MAKRPFPWPPDPVPQYAFLRIRLRGLIESVEHICRQPFVTFFVWLLIGIALSLPAGVWLLQYNIRAITENQGNDTGVTFYFVPGTPQAEIDAVVRELRARPLVSEIALTTADEALQEFRTATGYGEELSDSISNPLPASIDVSVDEHASKTEVELLANKYEAATQIESVIVDTEWMLQLRKIQVIAYRMTWVLGVLFGAGVVFITVAAVRLAMESKFDELKVISLLGGSDRFLRRSFNYCGVLYGCGGGVVATGIIVVTLIVIEQPLSDLAQSYGGTLNIVPMDYFYAGFLIAIGGILGLCGALYTTLIRTRRQHFLE